MKSFSQFTEQFIPESVDEFCDTFLAEAKRLGLRPTMYRPDFSQHNTTNDLLDHHRKMSDFHVDMQNYYADKGDQEGIDRHYKAAQANFNLARHITSAQKAGKPLSIDEVRDRSDAVEQIHNQPHYLEPTKSMVKKRALAKTEPAKPVAEPAPNVEPVKPESVKPEVKPVEPTPETDEEKHKNLNRLIKKFKSNAEYHKGMEAYHTARGDISLAMRHKRAALHNNNAADVAQRLKTNPTKITLASATRTARIAMRHNNDLMSSKNRSVASTSAKNLLSRIKDLAKKKFNW